MPVDVINLFKIIKIQEECRNARSVASCPSNLVQKKLPQITSVMKLCQIIGLRKALGFSNPHRVCECRCDWQSQGFEQLQFRLLERTRVNALPNSLEHSQESFPANQRHSGNGLSVFLLSLRPEACSRVACRSRLRARRQNAF